MQGHIGSKDEMVQGYSIKTNRYRLTQWGENGVNGYELYDHKFDKPELNNLANVVAYKALKDSLKKVIRDRIADARSVFDRDPNCVTMCPAQIEPILADISGFRSSAIPFKKPPA